VVFVAEERKVEVNDDAGLNWYSRFEVDEGAGDD